MRQFFFSLMLEFLKWKNLRRQEDIVGGAENKDFRRERGKWMVKI